MCHNKVSALLRKDGVGRRCAENIFPRSNDVHGPAAVAAATPQAALVVGCCHGNNIVVLKGGGEVGSLVGFLVNVPTVVARRRHHGDVRRFQQIGQQIHLRGVQQVGFTYVGKKRTIDIQKL